MFYVHEKICTLLRLKVPVVQIQKGAERVLRDCTLHILLMAAGDAYKLQVM